MRGENGGTPILEDGMKGTSPRARGKHHIWPSLQPPRRNIPACAGKTNFVGLGGFYSKEHPRVRGENATATARSGDPGGTSPRARGKHAGNAAANAKSRNIPACAGKTHLPSAKYAQWREHPRVRGENVGWQPEADKMGGTSPRARGKRFP